MRAEASSIGCVAHYACTPRAARVVRAISRHLASHLHTPLSSKRVRDVGCLTSRCAQRHLLSRVLLTTLAHRAACVVRAISTAPSFTLTSLVSKRVRDVGCLASRCAQRHLLSRVSLTTLARRAARVVRAISAAPSFTLTSLASKRVRDVGCIASTCAQRHLLSRACVAHYACTPRAARVVRAISRHLASHLLLSRASESKGCRLPSKYIDARRGIFYRACRSLRLCTPCAACVVRAISQHL